MASYTYDKAELVSRLMAAKVATGKTFDDIALELGTEIYRYAVKKVDKIRLSSLILIYILFPLFLNTLRGYKFVLFPTVHESMPIETKHC